jgi:hypothetical protein
MRRILQPVVLAAALIPAVIPNILMGQLQTNVTHALINGKPVEIPASFIGQPPRNGVASEGQALYSPEYRAFQIAQQAGDVSEMMKQAKTLVKAYPGDALAHVCEGAGYPKASAAWMTLCCELVLTEQISEARKANEELMKCEASTEQDTVTTIFKLAFPAIEAASEVRRQTLQESTGPAN